jgi:hypothetical protein
MSDQQPQTPDVQTNDETNVETSKPKRARRATNADFTVGQIAVVRAKARGIDTARASKEVRGILRANFDAVCKLDPRIRKHKTHHNDGNRWPAMNAKVREYVLDKSKRS